MLDVVTLLNTSVIVVWAVYICYSQVIGVPQIRNAIISVITTFDNPSFKAKKEITASSGLIAITTRLARVWLCA